MKTTKLRDIFKGNRNGEKDIGEIIELLLKNKSISMEDKRNFLSASFWEVMRTTADLFNLEYIGEVSVPYIITRITEKSPNFFNNLRVPPDYVSADVFRYQHPKTDITSEEMSSEEKRKFINTKKEFNEALDANIRNATDWFGQITKDYDPIGEPLSIEELELRKIHLEIGNSRLQAFKDAIEKNKTEINVLMRVVEDDGVTPHASYTANRLVNIGANVYNYERGEKLGAFKTGEVLPFCRQKVKKLRSQFETSIKDLSRDTDIDRKTLEKYESGELEIVYKDAKLLEDFFFRQIGEKPRFVKENEYVFTISRKFPMKVPGIQTQPTQPQFHREFTGVIIKDWEQAYNGIFYFTERRKLESPRITKNDLKRFGY